ncbi:pyridoxal-phosphate-dependent aminotransferase family protein [Candidatus Poriferisodalis sp.]|uniref:pyridoxal-phosphate-dependent aminotransferase family protein n=1 Tax=Candidatus Poriferisodalis sp. TaxID=3101277 RepID=UPI003B5B1826
MSLRHGRPLVMIPGPSVIPDRVLNAMRRPIPNIYEGEVVDLTYSLLDRLPALARTEHRAYIAISNGHGAWEMAVTNTLSRGDKVLVLEVGHFATNWAEMAALSGVKFEVLHAPDRAALDPEAITERLREDVSREFAAVLVAQTDTASSVRNDISAVRRAMDEADHPALLMADCVASLGCEQFEMDDWSVDVTVAGSQKGLMVPPGLGIVWVGPKAWDAHQRADLRTAYWDWTRRTDPDAHYWIFCGTPPVQHLWGLAEALDMIDEEGLENVWERHRVFASAIHAAVEAWSTPGGLELNVVDPAHRSNSVTMIRTGEVSAQQLRATCETEAGLTLGLSITGNADAEFRIGHMGHLNPPMLLGTLGTIEATLSAIDAPMGASGVAAAAQVIAKATTSAHKPPPAPEDPWS